jgi:starch synthase
MKVLLVGSEVSPIIKIGGLGDVMGALPKTLQVLGVNIDVIVPFYPSAKLENLKIYKSLELNIPFDSENYSVGVYKTQLPLSSVDTFLLKNDHFFGHGGENAFANNSSETEMFMFFDRAVVEFLKSQFNTYDLVHCNDWHTGLITHLLKDEFDMTRPATLFTVHNVMYQGVGDSSSVRSVDLTPGEHPLVDWDVADGDINMLLQGITSSDFVNAVSPTYAKELLTPEFGGGFSEVFKSRQGRLTGILNGIDYSVLPRDYDVYDVAEGKLRAKEKLYEKLGIRMPLDQWLRSPVFAFVGRLDPKQKGLDLLLDLFSSFASTMTQNKESPYFVLLGKGDFEWEEKFKKLNMANVSVNIAFDETLAASIYAGSDFLLVPSKYEPCGLIQMMAMFYGTLPVVRGVGGLKDSVEDGVTGFVFEDYSKDAFVGCVERALRVYSDKNRLTLMAQNAMKEDFSWDRSAEEYKKLYEKVVKQRQIFSGNI